MLDFNLAGAIILSAAGGAMAASAWYHGELARLRKSWTKEANTAAFLERELVELRKAHAVELQQIGEARDNYKDMWERQLTKGKEQQQEINRLSLKLAGHETREARRKAGLAKAQQVLAERRAKGLPIRNACD